MPKPVCVPCQRFFRPSRNGKAWTEMKPRGGALSPPGTSEPERWEFYKAWVGDEWQCQGCGTRIIVGHAGGPFAQDFMPGAKEMAEQRGANDVIVNDC